MMHYGLPIDPTLEDGEFDEESTEVIESDKPLSIDPFDSMQNALRDIVAKISPAPVSTAELQCSMNGGTPYMFSLFTNYDFAKPLPSEKIIEEIMLGLGLVSKPLWYLDSEHIVWKGW